MFEPVHGSAPDIAGQNQANPIATIDSLGLLLRETGRIKNDADAIAAGDRVGAAVRAVTPNFAGKGLDRSGYGTTRSRRWSSTRSAEPQPASVPVSPPPGGESMPRRLPIPQTPLLIDRITHHPGVVAPRHHTRPPA